MAVAYGSGASIHKITAANDTHAKRIKIKGYSYSHTAAGSVTLAALKSDGTAGVEVIIEILGAAGSKGWNELSCPIALPYGYIASNCTGTLLLHV